MTEQSIDRSVNQSVILTVVCIAAATARTTKSITVTTVTVQHLGRTAGTDNVSTGAERSNQPA